MGLSIITRICQVEKTTEGPFFRLFELRGLSSSTFHSYFFAHRTGGDLGLL